MIAGVTRSHFVWKFCLGLLVGTREADRLLRIRCFLEAADIAEIPVKPGIWPRRYATVRRTIRYIVNLVAGSDCLADPCKRRGREPKTTHLTFVQNVSPCPIDIKITSAPPTGIFRQFLFQPACRGFDPQNAIPIAVKTEHGADNQRNGDPVFNRDRRALGNGPTSDQGAPSD